MQDHGRTIPEIGFGVYNVGQSVYECVRYALDAGYRHIDTAAAYGNEAQVGRAIRESGVPREEVFVATKLWPTAFAKAEEAFLQSLSLLGLDYVDGYLLHWPGTDADLRRRAWDMVLQMHGQGLVRCPGVSNFLPVHLEDLIGHAGVRPSYDQLELHPWFQQREAVAFCRAQGIEVVAWSPLFRGRGADDPLSALLAAKYEKTPAQILLRWHIQKGHHPIPKSATPSRILENLAVFDFSLTEGEMADLDALQDGRHIGSDPMTFAG